MCVANGGESGKKKGTKGAREIKENKNEKKKLYIEKSKGREIGGETNPNIKEGEKKNNERKREQERIFLDLAESFSTLCLIMLLIPNIS